MTPHTLSMETPNFLEPSGLDSLPTRTLNKLSELLEQTTQFEMEQSLFLGKIPLLELKIQTLEDRYIGAQAVDL